MDVWRVVDVEERKINRKQVRGSEDEDGEYSTAIDDEMDVAGEYVAPASKRDYLEKDERDHAILRNLFRNQTSRWFVAGKFPSYEPKASIASQM